MGIKFATVPKADGQWCWAIRESDEEVVHAYSAHSYITKSSAQRGADNTETELRRLFLDKDEFFILRREHWEEMKQRLLDLTPSQIQGWIDKAEDAAVGYSDV
jgi:hypothetical protein